MSAAGGTEGGAAVPTEDEMREDLIFAAKFAEAGVRTEHWYVASGALMEAAAYFVYETVVATLHLRGAKFHGPSFVDPWSQRFDAKIPDDGIPALDIPASKAGEDMGFLIHFDRDKLLEDGDCGDACEISTINTRHLTPEDARRLSKNFARELSLGLSSEREIPGRKPEREDSSEETTKLGPTLEFWFRDDAVIPAVQTSRDQTGKTNASRKRSLRVPYKTLIAGGPSAAAEK